LTAQGFLAATTWTAVLAETTSSRFGASGFVLDTPQCGFTFYGHYKSSGGLMATKQ
jgi:hypothetical protein